MASKVSSFTSLKFPNELGTDEVPNYIRFEPTIVQYGGTYDTHGNGFSNPENNRNALVGATDIGSLTQGATGFASRIANNSNLSFQFGKGNFKFGISFGSNQTPNVVNRTVNARTDITARHLNSGCRTDPNRMFSAGSINLFMPAGISAKSGVNYTQTNMGATGLAAIDMAARSKADVVQGGPNGTDGGFSNIMKSLGAAFVNDALASDQRIGGALAVGAGVVTNNFSYQIFDGVEHRTFNYTFKLVPRSSEDSVHIKQICDTFLFYMLPEKSDGDLHFFEIPCQWNISYMRKGEKMSFYQQPYPCFLSSVDVTYGEDTGNTTFSDGAPMDVGLSLTFVEIEPMHRRS